MDGLQGGPYIEFWAAEKVPVLLSFYLLFEEKMESDLVSFLSLGSMVHDLVGCPTPTCAFLWNFLGSKMTYTR